MGGKKSHDTDRFSEWAECQLIRVSGSRQCDPVSDWSESAWEPACDVIETDGCYVMIVEVAGVKPQELEVIQQGRQVLIRGCRRELAPLLKTDVFQMEIHFGPFYRVISLPDEIDQASTKARLRDGFLVVECPKKRMKMEKRIDIE